MRVLRLYLIKLQLFSIIDGITNVRGKQNAQIRPKQR